MTQLRDTFGLEDMKAELIRDEGLVLEVYKDPGSGRAIGVGRNLDTQGLSVLELQELGLRFVSQGVKGDEAVAVIAEGGGSISKAAAMTLLVNDITDRVHQLDVFLPWWRLLSAVRQRVLLNMAFEMGSRGMMQKQAVALAFGVSGQFEAAADAMEASPWGQHVPKRPHELAQMMRLDKAVDRSGEPVT